MSNQNNQNPNELGAIWKKESNGKKFYSGKLTINNEEIMIVMFQNDRKPAGSTQPDWKIYRSTRPTQKEDSAPKQAAAKSVARPSPAPARGRPAPSPRPAPAPETQADDGSSTTDSTL